VSDDVKQLAPLREERNRVLEEEELFRKACGTVNKRVALQGESIFVVMKAPGQAHTGEGEDIKKKRAALFKEMPLVKSFPTKGRWHVGAPKKRPTSRGEGEDF